MQIAPTIHEYPKPSLPDVPEREEAEVSFINFLPLDAMDEDRAPPASVSSGDRPESLETPAGAVVAAATPKESDAGDGDSGRETGAQGQEATQPVASAGQGTEEATRNTAAATAPTANHAAPTMPAGPALPIPTGAIDNTNIIAPAQVAASPTSPAVPATPPAAAAAAQQVLPTASDQRPSAAPTRAQVQQQAQPQAQPQTPAQANPAAPRTGTPTQPAAQPVEQVANGTRQIPAGTRLTVTEEIKPLVSQSTASLVPAAKLAAAATATEAAPAAPAAAMTATVPLLPANENELSDDETAPAGTKKPAATTARQAQAGPAATVAQGVKPTTGNAAPLAPSADPSGVTAAIAQTQPTSRAPAADTDPTALKPLDAASPAGPAAATSTPDRPATVEAAQNPRPASLTQAVRDQVAVTIVRAFRDGTDLIKVQLSPPTLGRVDIRLDVAADGRVMATVAVDNQSTLELMQRDARNLERALEAAGLRTDSNSLSFGLRGDGGAGSRLADSGTGSNAGGRPDTTLEGDSESASDGAWRGRSHSGALDMRV